MYKINPDAKHTYGLVGDEKTPLYVIDDLLLNPEEVALQSARAANFEALVEKGFPGQRTLVDEEYKQTILEYVIPILEQFYQIPSYQTIDSNNCFYSLLDRPENELSPFQCIPHVDSLNRYYFAITHYINPGSFGGTAMYKHLPSGFENITQQRVKVYEQSVQHFLDTHGYPEQRYFKDSTDHYQLTAKVDYKPNRLVIYPGSLLHSAYINPETDLISDVNKGRLTSNMFIEFF